MAHKTHVAIVPSPGMGHLIPVVEFAKRLVRVHPNFQVTCIVPTIGLPNDPIKSVFHSLPAAIRHLYLPPVALDSLPARAQTPAAMSLSIDPLREVLKSFSESVPFSAIVFDMFSVVVLESVKDFNVPSYVFFPANATALSLCFHIRKLDRVVSCEYRDLPDPIKAPGCVPIHGRDLMDPVQDRKSKSYEVFLRLVEQLTLVDGIMVNSFTKIEDEPFKALQEEPGIPPVYPVGPLINDGLNSRVHGSECLEWLDGQPLGSVLFVSFGSGGTLSGAQLNELAFGLEMSEQKFLWVVRSPNDNSPSGAYYGANTHKDPSEFLPKGFVERMKGRGWVVPSWAPQAQVLSHPSTGGFLTHCGWNSTLESVVNGLPLIAWPLYAEQKGNAVLLSDHLNVALRPKTNENGIVTKEEIAKVVKALMEGEEGKLIGQRMEVLKDAAKEALSEEGDSAKALAELTSKWSNHINV